MKKKKTGQQIKKKIAVVGAGITGIVAIKALKEEGDLFEPVCFEATEEFGGTWRYHDEVIEGLASVMSSTVNNHSKEMGAISDFPPPKHYPNYMPHRLIYKYYYQYGQKHDCFRHVHYNMEVIKIQKADDYDETGCWIVTVKNRKTNDVYQDSYDGVFVGIGHSTYPKIPSFKNVENFKGSIVHSHSLKNVENYRNQNVAIIGIGCSGLDAAVETSNVANQVYLSTRRGAWILPRLGPFGLPFDYTFLRRCIFTLFKFLPVDLISFFLERILVSAKFSHGLYGIKPKHRILGQDPAISDLLPLKLVTGAVVLKGDVKIFAEDGIIFDGENEVTKLNSVILATGYVWKFPFFDDDIITQTGDMINLYKCMYPTQLKHPTLAVIGFVQPLGPGWPLGEIQCRYAVQLLKGTVQLPDLEKRILDVEHRHETNARRYPPSDRLTIHADFIPYMDEIASQFGAKPNFFKLAFTDPQLCWKLFWGPSLPYQYRLQGPHSWAGAREAIMKNRDRVKAPFMKGKKIKFYVPKHYSNTKLYFAVAAVMWFLAFMLF